MSYIKSIQLAQDHKLAMARLMSLMDLNPQLGSAEVDEIYVLALLIEKYEDEQSPINTPDPIETINCRME